MLIETSDQNVPSTDDSTCSHEWAEQERMMLSLTRVHVVYRCEKCDEIKLKVVDHSASGLPRN